MGVLDLRNDEAGDGPRGVQCRALFRFQDGQWAALPNEAKVGGDLAALWEKHPASVEWRICGESRDATVKSQRGAPWTRFSDVGRQSEIDDRALPALSRIASRSDRARPRILLLSSEECLDPDDWGPGPALEKGPLRALRNEFMRRANHRRLELPFTAQDVRVVEVWRSRRRGTWFVQLRLPTEIIGDQPDPEWVKQSYWISRKGADAFIGFGLSFAGAADFERKGQSELLLARNDYNDLGYILISSEGASLARFEWNAH